MTGEQRRNEIYLKLDVTDKPIPARHFAELYNVSRQVIVGDIALLRAQGADIIATHRGYLIKQDNTGKLSKTIAVSHSKEDTKKELELLVNMGIEIVDVTVEHPVYGQIIGQLNIKTHDDIEDFLTQDPELLSSLTEGIHLHTIICENEKHYIDAVHELDRVGFLYQD